MKNRQHVIDILSQYRNYGFGDPTYGGRVTMDEIIALLKQDEPHLLTVDEIRSGDRPIWLEERWSDGQIHGEWLSPYSREDEYGYVICGQRCLYLKHMGIYWRMWSDKPAQEKSESTAWLEEKES